MTSSLRPLTGALLSSFVLFTFFSNPAFAAQLTPTARLDTEVRFQGVDVDNADLGTNGSKNTGVGAAEARFKFTGNLTEKTLFFWEGRGVGRVGRGGFQSEDTGAISSSDSFLEWRQSYFQFSDVGAAPVSIRAGRQRVSDPYGLWWNQNFDALRVTYDTTLFKGSVIGGQNLFSYRTSGGDFTKNEQDLARVLAEGSWQYHYENFFETRVMYESDHSGIAVGDAENPLNPDSKTGHLVWGGLRASGKTASPMAGAGKLGYRVDLMAVRGNEDVATIGGGAITAINGQHVAGWAFDASTDIPLPNSKPLIHLGYAYGSGDSNAADGTDHAFRQSGMNGNFSHIGALSENTDNYGTVLRPDLTNIHILSAGVTMPVLQASDIGVIYRYYRLADPATSLASSSVSNVLDGVNKQLGQGVDFLFNMDVSKQWGLNTTRVQDISFRSSLGFFRSGDAYGTAKGETAVRGLVEMKVSF